MSEIQFNDAAALPRSDWSNTRGAIDVVKVHELRALVQHRPQHHVGAVDRRHEPGLGLRIGPKEKASKDHKIQRPSPHNAVHGMIQAA
eukprot:753167-Hanusia_phi.AAC.2